MPSTAETQYTLNLRADAHSYYWRHAHRHIPPVEVEDDEWEVKIGEEPHRFYSQLYPLKAWIKKAHVFVLTLVFATVFG